MNETASPAAGAIRIASKEHLSRGEMLLKGAFAVSALYGLGAVGPYVRQALAADEGEGDDIAKLNYLLPFEYLQVSLYNRGKSERNRWNEKMPLKQNERELMERLISEEGEHVSALREMIEKLGGKPDEKGEYAFAFLDFEMLLEMASVLETAAIGAYNGAIPALESQEARELAFSIVQVEGRHAATVLINRQEEPAPEAFDRGQTEQTARSAVVPYAGFLE